MSQIEDGDLERAKEVFFATDEAVRLREAIAGSINRVIRERNVPFVSGRHILFSSITRPDSIHQFVGSEVIDNDPRLVEDLVMSLIKGVCESTHPSITRASGESHLEVWASPWGVSFIRQYDKRTRLIETVVDSKTPISQILSEV